MIKIFTDYCQDNSLVFSLYDLNNDEVPELILAKSSKTSYGNYILIYDIFSYKNNSLVKLFNDLGHGTYGSDIVTLYEDNIIGLEYSNSNKDASVDYYKLNSECELDSIEHIHADNNYNDNSKSCFYYTYDINNKQEISYNEYVKIANKYKTIMSKINYISIDTTVSLNSIWKKYN